MSRSQLRGGLPRRTALLGAGAVFASGLAFYVAEVRPVRDGLAAALRVQSADLKPALDPRMELWMATGRVHLVPSDTNPTAPRPIGLESCTLGVERTPWPPPWRFRNRRPLTIGSRFVDRARLRGHHRYFAWSELLDNPWGVQLERRPPIGLALPPHPPR